MTIQVGDTLPDTNVQIMTAEGPSGQSIRALAGKGKAVLFAVPGAFTPGCSKSHLPGFVTHSKAILDKGVDRILCLSVNDAFVMDAWGKDQNAEHITMVADGNGELTRALGLQMDARDYGMGERSQRYAMIIEDGQVTQLNVEPGPGINVSNAETILAAL